MASPSQVSFQIEDARGKTKSVVFHVDSTNTQAEIEAFVLEIDQLLDDCLDGYITQVTVTKQVSFSVSGSSAAADSKTSHGGLLTFAATGINRAHGIYIPAYARTEIEDSGSIENTDDTAVLLTALLGGANVALTDAYDNALATFSSGEQRDRK